MKTFLLAFPLLFISFVNFGQTNEEIELIKEIFRMEKKAVVDAYLDLSEEDAAAFAPIYEEYEQARRTTAQRRIDLIQDYANKYATLTDEDADQLVKNFFSIQKESMALRKKYYKKVKKVLNAKAATTFLQIEEYIQTAIRMSLMEVIPFVEDRG